MPKSLSDLCMAGRAAAAKDHVSLTAVHEWQAVKPRSAARFTLCYEKMNHAHNGIISLNSQHAILLFLNESAVLLVFFEKKKKLELF